MTLTPKLRDSYPACLPAGAGVGAGADMMEPKVHLKLCQNVKSKWEKRRLLEKKDGWSCKGTHELPLLQNETENKVEKKQIFRIQKFSTEIELKMLRISIFNFL